MWDIVQGILAIIFVVLIFIMRESENKWIAYVGAAIFILAKILN
ncbi:hypothetical protein [Acetoanaerobium sticklandii]